MLSALLGGRPAIRRRYTNEITRTPANPNPIQFARGAAQLRNYLIRTGLRRTLFGPAGNAAQVQTPAFDIDMPTNDPQPPPPTVDLDASPPAPPTVDLDPSPPAPPTVDLKQWQSEQFQSEAPPVNDLYLNEADVSGAAGATLAFGAYSMSGSATEVPYYKQRQEEPSISRADAKMPAPYVSVGGGGVPYVSGGSGGGGLPAWTAVPPEEHGVFTSLVVLGMLILIAQQAR